MSTQFSSSATRDMLAEIGTGTMLEAINAVRYITAPPGPLFIPHLDAILGPFRSSSGTSTLQRGDMIEIVGSSGSGKTSLLLFLLLTHLLPYSTDLPLPHGAPLRIRLGGKNCTAALLLCTSSASPIPALARAIRGHVRDCLSGIISMQSGGPGGSSDRGQGVGRYSRITEQGIEGVVRSSLARLRIVRVKPRYRHWSLGLLSLLQPPRDREGDKSGQGEDDPAPSLVCLDGLSKAFWPERWGEEERASVGGPGSGDGGGGGASSIKARSAPLGIKMAEEVGMRDVMHAIGRLRGEMGCVVVTTTQGLWHEKKPGSVIPTQFFSPHLPAPFPSPWAFARGVGGGGGGSGGTNDRDTETDDNLPLLVPKDPTYWPLTFQLVLTGRARGLQLPTDTTLNDALEMSISSELAGGTGVGVVEVDKYVGRIRVKGAEAPLGARSGVEFRLGIGVEGVETYADD